MWIVPITGATSTRSCVPWVAERVDGFHHSAGEPPVDGVPQGPPTSWRSRAPAHAGVDEHRHLGLPADREHLDALLARRRPRGADEAPVWMAQAILGDGFHWIAPSRFGYLRSTMRAGATFDGPWALFRLMDAASPRRTAAEDRLRIYFTVGQRIAIVNRGPTRGDDLADVKLDAAAILRGEWPPAASLKTSDAAGHAAIVMITDGQGNLGPNLNDMAKLTQVLGLKIYTLGVGTPEGAVLKAEGIQARVKLDEAPLQQVAEITGGEYFRAVSGKDIGRLYDSLRIRLAAGQLQLMELTAPVAALGLLLVVMASAWNLARRGRIL